MKLELSNGLDHVWQWDTDITMTITEPENVPKVHFRWGGKAVELDATNNQVVIPAELMQLPKDIVVWAYTPDHTMDMARIPLKQRAKPPGYAYTPTEIKTWEWLDERIAALETEIPTIDTALSETSTNPVQNKIIKEALDKKLEAIPVDGTTIKLNDEGQLTLALSNANEVSF